MNFEHMEELGKSYLILKKQETQETDTVTLGMLENNDIKGILPFYLFREDDVVEFRYDTTGFVSIREKFPEKVHKADVLNFLKSVVEICGICEDYMIDIRQVVLDSNCIFTKERGIQIYFILLPVMDTKAEFGATLKEIIVNMRFDTEEDCSYVAELLRCFPQDRSFSLLELSNTVKAIEENLGRQRVLHKSPVKPEKKEKINSVKESTVKENIPVKTSVIEYGEDVSSSEDGVKSVFSIFGGKHSIQKKKASSKNQKKSPFSKIAIQKPGEEDYINEVNGNPKGSQTIKSQKIEIETYEADEEDFGVTELRRKNDDNGKVSKIGGRYEIVRVTTGDRYVITEPITKIGRRKQVTDIHLSGNLYVGRLHAILYKDENGLFVEDNASENGTYVNDSKRKISGRVRLESGDHLYLGNEELIIK